MLLKTLINKTARVIALTSFFIVSLFILSDCEEETAKSRDYPRVKTMPVSNITGNGATFNGEIFSLGSETVIEHGFVWGTAENPTLENNKIFLGESGITASFNADIVTTLKKDSEYTVRSFAQTDEHIVYGIPVTFKSLGSGAPVINGFEPDSVAWMDTLTVTGRNFSWVANDNTVRINQLQCTVVSSTDTTLKVIVNKNLTESNATLSVELTENLTTFTGRTMILKPPVLYDFYPKQGRWGDTLIITGNNFQSSPAGYDISATMGGHSGAIIEKGRDTLLFIVPGEIAVASNTLSVKVNLLNLVPSDKFALLPPFISGISPKDGTWLTTLILKGKFHPQKLRNIVTVGDSPATIISNYEDSIKVSVPESLVGHNNLVICLSAPFTIVSPDTFRLFAPEIESVTPLSGASTSIVTIKGRYFKNNLRSASVTFGELPAAIIRCYSTSIDCNVPNPISNGPVSMIVSMGLQKTVIKDPFSVLNPVITNVFPLNGTFNDEITIEGENLVSSSFGLRLLFTNNGGWPYRNAAIVSASQDRVVLKVPLDLDSIPKKILITSPAGIPLDTSTFKFVLNPPEVISISPSSISVGTTITISGKNFYPSNEIPQAFWGTFPLTITSATTNTIIATYYGIQKGTNRINIKAGGYVRYYPLLYTIN